MSIETNGILASEYKPAEDLCNKYGLGRYRSVRKLQLVRDAYRNAVMPTDAALTWALRASSRSAVQEQMKILETGGLVTKVARTASSGNVWMLTALGKECVKEADALERDYQQQNQ